MTGYIWDWDASTEGNNVLVGSGSGVSLAEGWAPSTVNNAMRGLMGQVAGWKTLIEGSIAAGGTANAITVTSGLAHTAYAEPMLISFKASAANTGATTINVDSIGTKSIKLSDGRALPADSIVASGIFWVSYDAGDDVFYLLNPSTTLKTEYGYRNLLHNGGFQVAQRGDGAFTSATTPANNDDSYLIDGCVLLSDGNDIADVSRNSALAAGMVSGWVLRGDTETANKKFGFLFPIEGAVAAQVVDAGVASLQFKARIGSGNATLSTIRAHLLAWSGTEDSITSDVVSAWGAAGANPTFAANWTAENTGSDLTLTSTAQTFTIKNITVDTASASNLAVFIHIDDTDATVGDDLFIGDVQLEVGPVCTAYEQRPVQVDQALCHRYFRRVTLPGIDYGHPSKNGTATTQLYWAHDFTPMRATPSGSTTNLAVDSDSVGSFNVGNGRVRWRTTTALTAGTSVVASGSFDLSAEL